MDKKKSSRKRSASSEGYNQLSVHYQGFDFVRTATVLMTLPFSSTPYRIQKALTQTPEFVYVGKEFTTLTHFCQNTKKKNKDEQSKTDDFHKENKIVENQNFLEASLIACIFKYIQNKLIELNSTKTRVFDVRYGVVDGKTHISIILPSTERSAIKLAVRIMVKALSNKIVKLTQDNIKVTDPESYRVYKQVVKDCIIKRLQSPISFTVYSKSQMKGQGDFVSQLKILAKTKVIKPADPSAKTNATGNNDQELTALYAQPVGFPAIHPVLQAVYISALQAMNVDHIAYVDTNSKQQKVFQLNIHREYEFDMSFFENVDKFIKARLNFLVKKDVKRNSGLKPKVAKSESEIKERKEALFNKKLALLESLPFLQGAIPHLDLFKQAREITKEKLNDQLEFLLDVKSDFQQQAGQDRGYMGYKKK